MDLAMTLFQLMGSGQSPDASQMEAAMTQLFGKMCHHKAALICLEECEHNAQEHTEHGGSNDIGGVAAAMFMTTRGSSSMSGHLSCICDACPSLQAGMSHLMGSVMNVAGPSFGRDIDLESIAEYPSAHNMDSLTQVCPAVGPLECARDATTCSDLFAQGYAALQDLGVEDAGNETGASNETESEASEPEASEPDYLGHIIHLRSACEAAGISTMPQPEDSKAAFSVRASSLVVGSILTLVLSQV
jgi:hypothetical protein